MRPPPHVPRLRDYVRMVADSWMVVVLATVLSAGVGWVTWQTMPPAFQSSSRVIITSPGAATSFDAFYGQLNSSSRALTFQLLAHSEQVTGRTIEQLGLSDTPAGLAARIQLRPSAGVTFDVVATGNDPAQTREVAQAITTNLIEVQRQLATVDGSGIELVELDKAGVAQRVGSMWRTIVAAGVLGFVMSVLLVIGHALLRGRLLGRDELNRIVGESDADMAR